MGEPVQVFQKDGENLHWQLMESPVGPAVLHSCKQLSLIALLSLAGGVFCVLYPWL